MLKKLTLLTLLLSSFSKDTLAMNWDSKKLLACAAAGAVSYFALKQGYKWWQWRSYKNLLQTNEYALHEACQEFNLEKVKMLLAAGALVNTKEPNGLTPLFIAICTNYIEMFEYLIEHGADIHARINGGFTALFLASQKGRIDIVKYLVEHGATVNARTDDGGTALIVASQEGHKEIVKYLLDHGAEVNAKINNGATALYIASRGGHKDIVKYLVEHRAEVNAKKDDGATTLYIASHNGHIEIVKYLLEHGASVNILTNQGVSPFHPVALGNHENIAKILICKSFFHPTLQSKPESTDTLQHLCLLSLLDNLDSSDEESTTTILPYLDQLGKSAIELVADQAPLKLQQKLIQFWKDENSKGKEKGFINTLCERHLAKLQLLLKKKIQGIAPFEGMTARDIAHNKGHNNLVTLFDRVSSARSFDQLDKVLQQPIKATIENKLAIH